MKIRYLGMWILLIAVWTLTGCDDDGTDDSKDNDNDTDSENNNDSENKEENLSGATLCNETNLIGTWNIDFAGDDFYDAYTEQYVFSDDGTFTTEFAYDDDQLVGEGTWVVDGSNVVLTFEEIDEEYEAEVVYKTSCVFVGDMLYLDADVLINPTAKANSLDGTWSIEISESDNVEYSDGTSEYYMEITQVSVEVNGSTFNYSETDAYEDRTDGVVTDKSDGPIIVGSGTVRADSQKVYLTFTEIEIDKYDAIEINKEKIMGLRIADSVLLATSDADIDPKNYAFIKKD